MAGILNLNLNPSSSHATPTPPEPPDPPDPTPRSSSPTALVQPSTTTPTKPPDSPDIPPLTPSVRTYTKPNSPPPRPFALKHKLSQGNYYFDAGKTLYIDDGAMINVMDWSFFGRHAASLSPLQPSSVVVRMADGSVVPSKGIATITVHLASGIERIEAETQFEVLQSSDSWDILLGLPWLQQVKGIHNYDTNELAVQGHSTVCIFKSIIDTPLRNEQTIWLAQISTEVDRAAQPQLPQVPADPHMDRPHRIWNALVLGADMSPTQKRALQALVFEFHDVWAESLADLKPAKCGVHKLVIDPTVPLDTSCPSRARRMTPPILRCLHAHVDELLAADIIAPIEPDQVKCCSPIVMAAKRTQGPQEDYTTLKRKIDTALRDQSHEQPTTPSPAEPPPTSWRMCHDFRQLNTATVVPSFIPGNLEAIVARHSGKRWINVLDLMAAFYAYPLDPAARPYTSFFVPGRGYMAYNRMPMGLTGSPVTEQIGMATAFKSIVHPRTHGLLDG